MDKYTYEQAFNDSVNYFNGDELAAKAFLDKYALRNNNDEILENTPEKMHIRLASEFARIQKNKYKSPLSKDAIFNLLNRFEKIIPQGSPMFGIGNTFQVCSISNCFVLDIPEDSYNSILDVDKQLVNISKRRGGVGIDLSKLRPRGSATNNAARSSTGIISWMERYSNSIREVGQHGRRGALMLTLSVHHPDILDFATVKNDNSKVTGANISVRLSQEFLDAVKTDSDYELRFPVDYKETNQKPKVSKFVKAKEIWKTIIKSAWMRAEPGLVMWDNVLKGPADCYEKYRSVTSNPCQPGWAKLITKDGVKQLKDINVGEKVWSESGWTTVVKKWSTGVKDVYKYETTSGVFYGTENHKLVSNGEKVEAKDCESIDILSGPFDSSVVFDNQDIMDGMVIGDGTVHKCSNSLILLCIGKDDGDYFSSEIASLITKRREGINEFVYEIKTSITVDELPYTYNRKVPSRFLYGNKNKVCGFLRGLYTANGSVCGERVTLKTTSKNMVEDVQCMLSSIGISSYYTTNKATNVEFSNGTYLCKESYDINITKDRNKFAQIIGFLQQYKTDKVNDLITSKWKSKHASKPSKLSYDIKNVQLVSTEEVFDLTVDNQQHTYWTQGCNVSNCSEIFMPSLESCRLLAINLFGYVKNPFTEKSYFDYDEFYKETKIAQRLMDDVVDLESEKIDQIIAKVKSDPESEEIKKDEINLWERIKKLNDECRRTGLGITAIGDTLAAIGVKYGSEESIAVTEKIYQTLKLAAYESSIEMAEELGSFKDYDAKKEKNCEFIQLIKAERPDLYERMVKVGRRNIALTTTAPTGTVSLMAQTSSGIEPVFSLGYKRRKKINPNDKNGRVDFVDQNGDSWQEFMVYHHKVKQWIDVTGNDKLEDSPWWGATANEIDWINRVKLQAAAQKHVCHAISSTINLPETVTEEKVAEIYETAFASGVKGITIYRDNCRTGVLVLKEEKKKENKINHNNAPKRPQVLDADVHHLSYQNNRYYVVVGLLEKDPYEIFIGLNNDGEGDVVIPKSIKAGFLAKEGKGKYVLKTEDFSCVLKNTHTDENADVLARMLSSALRHGCSIEFLTHQLEKTKGGLTSFSKILSRAIKKYIKDGVVVSGEACPECGGKLVRESGCKICKGTEEKAGCGWTACN